VSTDRPLRVALIGTGARAGYLYGPLLKALPAEMALVSVWGRSGERARQLGESLSVPWYTDFGRLLRETAPELGIFHWTDVGYDSALRWWRSSRFLAERGMGITVGVGLDVEEWLTLLAPGGEAPRFITLERRWERIDGGALEAVVAHTGDPAQPIVRWDNPFRSCVKGRGVQWHDDEIGVACCLMSLVNAVRQDTQPTYGPHQARLDQEIVLAIRQSASEGGCPVRLPLEPTAD